MSAADAVLPYTGQEFLDSLDDGREVWIYGERVKQITEHPAFRNTARMIARLYDALHRGPCRRAERADLPDRMGRLHAPLFRGADVGRGAGRGARRDRRLGAADLWLARPLARLQGGISRHARRQRRVLCAVPGQCAPLVPPQPGAGAVHQPRDHPSAGRSQHGAGRAGRPDRHLHARHQGDRRRHPRQRRQGRRHRIGADAFHLCRASRADPGAGQEFRHGLHRADQRARREADLPRLERAARRGAGQPVRLSAVEPARRERRDLRHG